MLFPNGQRVLTYPGRHMAGSLAASGAMAYGGIRGARFNRFVSDVYAKTAGTPDGYTTPGQPVKSGGLSANTTGAGSFTSNAQSGFNLDASVSGDGGVTSAPLGLIISIAAALVASGGISSASTQALTSLVATITGSGSLEATAQGLADIAASIAGAGAVSAGNTALMDIASTIRGYGDLTPEGIRDVVWSAILANYPNSGTAGNALSTASSGGVDLNALAQAVWEYAQRKVDVEKMNGYTVTGTGQENDPWRATGVSV